MSTISLCRRQPLIVIFNVLITLIFFHQVPTAQASPDKPVGVVSALKGAATVIRGGAESLKPVLLNSPVNMQDIFQT